MQTDSVKHIVLYFKAIPEMLRLLERERYELESKYSGFGGAGSDGMPHGSSVGKPTEALGLRAAEDGTGKRLAEIEAKKRVLVADAAVIRGCLDALNGKYKQVLSLRYVSGYSWPKIATRISAPDSTVRNWNDKALKRLGEVLEETPEVEGLLIRASRART